ncbi:MAG: NeuD/PglB/VioB family sugar acetyltransferase [Cyclobacteriaceae bacterium]|nr:NeuD/PglB/VioB family sugar acetyltransferase [Cyclobacteriaceae bacterium]
MIIIGGGGHASVVLDCLNAMRVHVTSIFDSQNAGDLMGVPRIKSYQPDMFPDAHALVAIGDNGVRKRVVQTVKHAFINVIHPSALISDSVQLGVGNMIIHRAIVQARTVIGNHIIINTGAQIDHDCVLGDFVHVAPGAVLCGAVTVGEGVLIGAGAVIIPGISIGAGATVGAGAVVRQNVSEHAVVVGNPARVIKKKNA